MAADFERLMFQWLFDKLETWERRFGFEKSALGKDQQYFDRDQGKLRSCKWKI